MARPNKKAVLQEHIVWLPCVYNSSLFVIAHAIEKKNSFYYNLHVVATCTCISRYHRSTVISGYQQQRLSMCRRQLCPVSITRVDWYKITCFQLPMPAGCGKWPILEIVTNGIYKPTLCYSLAISSGRHSQHWHVPTPSDDVTTTFADPDDCVLLERCAGGNNTSLAFVHDVSIWIR